MNKQELLLLFSVCHSFTGMKKHWKINQVHSTETMTLLYSVRSPAQLEQSLSSPLPVIEPRLSHSAVTGKRVKNMNLAIQLKYQVH